MLVLRRNLEPEERNANKYLRHKAGGLEGATGRRRRRRDQRGKTCAEHTVRM